MYHMEMLIMHHLKNKKHIISIQYYIISRVLQMHYPSITIAAQEKGNLTAEVT